MRLLLCGVIGAAAWVIYVSLLGDPPENLQVLILLAAPAGMLYAAAWYFIGFIARGLGPIGWYVLGAFMPYITISLTIVLLFYIFVTIYFWWLFVPAGLLSAFVLRCDAKVLGARRLFMAAEATPPPPAAPH